MKYEEFLDAVFNASLDRVLNELGVTAQPPAKPQPPRREDPSKSAGVWYRDGNIPH